jgi:oligopeptidase B
MVKYIQVSKNIWFSVLCSLIIIFLLVGMGGIQCGREKRSKPPVAKKIKKELTIHGHTRQDPYYWLNERNNPEVMSHLKAENKYKEAVLVHTRDFQESLFNEITSRIKKTDMSVPYKFQGYYYYKRYEGSSEYPLYCRKKGNLQREEEILLNVNEMSKGFSFFQVREPTVSPDNQKIAYGVDTVSRRKYTLYFKDLKSGKILEEKIPNTSGDAVWANDNKTVFYTTKDHTLREYKIFKHILGTSPSKDIEIYHETDPTFYVYVFKSKSKKYIFIESYHTLSSEFRFLEADNPGEQFSIFQKREKGLEYNIEHFRDKFYIKTNLRAKNFCLMETPVSKTSKENWTDVIPPQEDVLLEDFEVFKEFLVVEERIKGLPNLRIISWDKKNDHYIRFEEATYTAYISKNLELDTDWLRYGYTSLTTPESKFDYNMKTRQQKLLKREEVLGNFDPKNYFSERLYARARDNTRIPISLVYKRGMNKDGNNPLLLYGYGSYGYSRDPSFRSDRLSLLDRGFVYAIAHIRGGQEMGRQWYEDGKLLKKKNTFTDFIDCAEYLIQEKFTDPRKLFARGGSAGGLLMGAITNMRPDLFRGIIADVPWVDVVTTMLDDSIPLTTSEYDEWGDPNKKEFYDYMLSYSPYDNVIRQDYPAMLITTGFHDSQVQYFEPAKWVQKLRENNTGDNVILFHINMDAGHSGVSGRFRKYRETALEYAFMLDLAGIKN